MKLLPLCVFWCLWFLNFFTRASFSPVLPLIEGNLSISHGEAGGFVTSYSFGYAVTLLIAGRFVSTWGYKRTVAAGISGIGLTLIALQWVEHYFTFHILFLLLGLASGTYIPSIVSIITETYDHKEWGKAIGLHDSAASAAIFSAPILFAFGLQFLPWKGILLLQGIACLILPLAFWRVSIEPQPRISPRGSHYLNLFRRKPVWIMAVLCILSSAANMGVYSMLPLYLINERGMEYSFANNLVGISRLGGIVIQVFVGFFVDRYGYKRILFISLLTTGLSTLSLSLVPSFSLLLITLFIQAALSLAFFPVALAAIAKLTSPEERSMGIGAIISAGVIFGMGGAPLLLGIIADHFSFQVGILWMGVLTTLSSLMVRCLEDD
jgi:MFS transporter, NNP family, nitrate/nitrite transporter